MKGFENVINFFKSRKMTTEIGPGIEINYAHWTSFAEAADVEETLKKAWEQLRSELGPTQIKKQEWNTYREGCKQERLLVEIEGVLLQLNGPYYRDPEYKPRPPEEPKTTTQTANELTDRLLKETNVLWAITHCSSEKFYTFINFLKATKETAQKPQ